jgi:hypothetical protein
MWGAIVTWLNIGDPAWAWRRRVIFAGSLVFLSGVAKAIWLPTDIARDSMLITNCGALFTATLGIYAGLTTIDDHNIRETERKSERKAE